MHAIKRCQATPGRGKVIKRGMNTSQGQDAAYPQRRCQGSQEAITSIVKSPIADRAFLKAGSILALRFQKLYELQLK